MGLLLLLLSDFRFCGVALCCQQRILLRWCWGRRGANSSMRCLSLGNSITIATLAENNTSALPHERYDDGEPHCKFQFKGLVNAPPKPHVVPSASEMQVIITPNNYTSNKYISWCCFLPCRLQLTAVPNRENTEQDPGVRCMKQAAFACIMPPICRPPKCLMILLFCRLVLSRPRRGLGSDHSTTLDPDSHRWFMRTVSCPRKDHARMPHDYHNQETYRLDQFFRFSMSWRAAREV